MELDTPGWSWGGELGVPAKAGKGEVTLCLSDGKGRRGRGFWFWGWPCGEMRVVEGGKGGRVAGGGGSRGGATSGLEDGVI